MAKVHISQLSQTVQRALSTLAVGEAIEARTFKKDRGITVLKQDHNHFVFKQFGYDNKTIVLDENNVLKQLKKAIPKEFPRSNIAWITYFNDIDAIESLGIESYSQPSLF